MKPNNNALKKKILLSNASDVVKAKAIKKVMENGMSERQWNIAMQAAKDAEPKLTMLFKELIKQVS
jgi:hypothetical protein